MARAQRGNPKDADAPTARGTRWRLLLLGCGVAVLFVVATLPAGILAGRLQKQQVTAAAYDGSVWSGKATGLAWRGAAVGDVAWRVRPLAMLRGRVAADLRLERPDGSGSASVAAAVGGSVDVTGVSADLPVEALSQLRIGVPAGWRGRLRGHFESIRMEAGWPVSATGTLELHDVVAPPPLGAALGSFSVVLPDPRSVSNDRSGDGFTARVSDKGGPLSVDARFTLAAGRSFLLEGTLAPRTSLPPGLLQAIEFLGPADAAGQRPFSVSGTF